MTVAREPLTNDGPPRGKHILVVEDRASLRDLLAEIFSFDGHTVDTVANGALALEQLQGRSYDLIVSDLRMPVLDGPGLYRALRQSKPDLLGKLMFVTGNAEDPTLGRFLNDTGVMYVSKPFTVETIQQAANRVLRAGDAAK